MQVMEHTELFEVYVDHHLLFLSFMSLVNESYLFGYGRKSNVFAISSEQWPVDGKCLQKFKTAVTRSKSDIFRLYRGPQCRLSLQPGDGSLSIQMASNKQIP